MLHLDLTLNEALHTHNTQYMYMRLIEVTCDSSKSWVMLMFGPQIFRYIGHFVQTYRTLTD